VFVTECDQVQQEPSTPTMSRQTRSDYERNRESLFLASDLTY